MAQADSKTQRTFQIGTVLTLAAAHCIHDVHTAFLAPLLPLLISKFGLSLAAAGALSVFNNIPSFLNPFLGAFVDRHALSRYLVIFSPAVTAVGMCLLGVAPNYGVLVILMLTSGIAVAAIHLGAPVLISEAAGDRLGKGTSFFMVGGEIARTVGPLIAVQAVTSLTLEGMWKLLPVGFIASVILWFKLRKSSQSTSRKPPTGLVAMWKRMKWIILGVGGILMARACLVAATMAFLPTLLVSQGETLWWANIYLSIFELAGAVGALTSGTISDLLGRRSVLLVALIGAPISMLAFLSLDGPITIPLLLLIGFTTLSTTPVLFAVMIERSGSNRAPATGTFLLMTFAIRSLVVPGVGAMGDAFGLANAFYICALIAFLGIPFAFLIPAKNPKPEEA